MQNVFFEVRSIYDIWFIIQHYSITEDITKDLSEIAELN